jgi:6-phosphogluconolactonase (cycloisomerase 2 family)
VYTIGANGLLTAVANSPYATSQQPVYVQLDNTGKYVYVANRDNATITGYLIGTAGALTLLNGSPYGAGSGVTALAADNTGKYIFAAALNGTPDLSMYSFDTVSPGKLVLATSTATGTDPAGAIAVATTR